MLRRIDALENYSIQGTDGEVGRVCDFLFNDASWAIRYLVVECGSWLSSRKVLISPMSIGSPDWEHKILPLAISREQVRASPDIDTEQPVSRQHEIELLGHYAFPHYWAGPELWGMNAYPIMAPNSTDGFIAASPAVPGDREGENRLAEVEQGGQGDPHLRSCKAMHNYGIHARDGEIGHVQGLVVEDASWAVRYFVVRTGNWWIGHQVLIATAWIRNVSWFDSTVSVDLTRAQVEAAPPYVSAENLDRVRESMLHEHYDRKAYWLRDPKQSPELVED